MKNTYQLQIPKELEQYRTILEESVKPYIKVSGTLAETTLFESKFGGYPYLPIDQERPKDSNGQPMMLLAQLNFEEMPHVEYMPQEGMLQFFVSAADELYGADFDQPTTQKDFRIIYHSTIIEDLNKVITDFSYLNTLELEDFIIPEAAKLKFELDYQPVTSGDYRFEKIFSEDIDWEEIVDEENNTELGELYDDLCKDQGHKIGGYPFFTQTDPREWEEKYQQHDILLLQIDTDDSLNIMWGDSGVANFFIKKEDLLNLDFSNVIYNWDCY
ncbi:YwqG family protein [Bacillus pacificus]|uniref:YwqG family protein n=1 Tax=Bacillus pacificus TaxID=2026187 RepID=UPI0021D28653|nr:YwqG family protein [Bacillus pacificus]MCU5733554.1 YwqG family protein [Bacillus pacificus]